MVNGVVAPRNISLTATRSDWSRLESFRGGYLGCLCLPTPLSAEC